MGYFSELDIELKEAKSRKDKDIKLSEQDYNEMWWDMQWPEDKEKMIEQEKKLNGLVKWLGI
ncbi:hypothetical protein UFOVP263_25 [uncultured Caudovirales phage]|uniref:Uncharacterized protein n=1 Tax=uncultured Caudovirales phage TaxID=2100421 RepID=A0A6J5LI47_9CAUD|nr:hypothetical protein UFOVP263_25 [uncultured Caudovirales phage]CAB4242082.1 hypothetical protein UFOVP91_38 [uncultured Caudovirales phage]